MEKTNYQRDYLDLDRYGQNGSKWAKMSQNLDSVENVYFKILLKTVCVFKSSLWTTQRIRTYKHKYMKKQN